MAYNYQTATANINVLDEILTCSFRQAQRLELITACNLFLMPSIRSTCAIAPTSRCARLKYQKNTNKHRTVHNWTRYNQLIRGHPHPPPPPLFSSSSGLHQLYVRFLMINYGHAWQAGVALTLYPKLKQWIQHQINRWLKQTTLFFFQRGMEVGDWGGG